MFGELTAKEAEVVVIQALEAWLNVELSADHLQRRKGVRGARPALAAADFSLFTVFVLCHRSYFCPPFALLVPYAAP